LLGVDEDQARSRHDGVDGFDWNVATAPPATDDKRFRALQVGRADDLLDRPRERPLDAKPFALREPVTGNRARPVKPSRLLRLDRHATPEIVACR
jgi:hypothetical protein